MTDHTRYPIGTYNGQVALWCTDCDVDPARSSGAIWTEDDATEQVTELSLANLDAIADQHEQRHHAEAKPDFFQAGLTYIENRPFAAPETLAIFCELVTTHPRAGAGLRALGFQCHAHPGNDWVSTGMTLSDWPAGWSTYTPLGIVGRPEPPAPAPHRVKVHTVRMLGPARTDEWHDEAMYDIEHTAQCDALPYGENCWLDQQTTDVGTGDWPTESGQYIATGRPEKSFNGEVTEYDFYIDFEPIVELGLATADDEDDEEPLTLLDVDPDAVHATATNDYWEEAHEGQGPF